MDHQVRANVSDAADSSLNSVEPVVLASSDTNTLLTADPAESELENSGVLKPISLRERVFNWRTLAGFLLSAAILAFFISTVKVDLGTIWQNILRVQPLWLVAGFAIYYVAFIARGFRWQMLLKNAGFEKENASVKIPSIPPLIEIIFLSWFVNCLVPAKLGDAYRGYLMKKNYNTSFSRTMGTIFAERIADVLVLFGLLCLGGVFAFSRLTNQMGNISIVFGLGLLLVVAIVAGLIVMRYYSHFIERLLPHRTKEFYRRFQQGVVSSFKRETQIPLYLLTVFVWICEGLRLYCVLQGLELNPGISVVVFIALASSLLTTIPFTPAGLGAVEGTMVFVLVTFGVEKNLAGSVALLDRVISYWSIILIGIVVYLFSKKK